MIIVRVEYRRQIGSDVLTAVAGFVTGRSLYMSARDASDRVEEMGSRVVEHASGELDTLSPAAANKLHRVAASQVVILTQSRSLVAVVGGIVLAGAGEDLVRALVEVDMKAVVHLAVPDGTVHLAAAVAASAREGAQRWDRSAPVGSSDGVWL